MLVAAVPLRSYTLARTLRTIDLPIWIIVTFMIIDYGHCVCVYLRAPYECMHSLVGRATMTIVALLSRRRRNPRLHSFYPDHFSVRFACSDTCVHHTQNTSQFHWHEPCGSEICLRYFCFSIEINTDILSISIVFFVPLSAQVLFNN